MTTKEFNRIRDVLLEKISHFEYMGYKLIPYEKLTLFDIEGEYFIGVDSELFYKYRKKIGVLITEEDKIKLHYKEVQKLYGFGKTKWSKNWNDGNVQQLIRNQKIKELFKIIHNENV